jgi:phage shock protein PspC (stress-responsive transcriptional regulator)
MSNSYPPQPPRKLTRSTSNRLIGGVCGGVAQYLNMDVTLVRILTVLISLFTGVPVILYIIALFVIPEEGSPAASPQYPPVTGAQDYAAGYPAPGASSAQPEYATYPGTTASAPPPRSDADDSVWGSEGPPWEQRQPDAAPPTAAAPPPTAAPEAEPLAPSEPEAPVVPPDSGDDKNKGDRP